jgi:hypothetical protein
LSILQARKVWELDIPRNEALVLLAYADHGKEGDSPSQNLVAWRTGYSRKEISRITKRLLKKNVIKVVKAEPGQPTQYALTPENGPKKTGFEEWRRGKRA